MSGVVAPALPEPRQCVTDCIDCRANGFGRRLHEIDVFRVAQRSLEKQFVDCCATAKSNLSFQGRRVEEIA
jgi:hypothetical protein